MTKLIYRILDFLDLCNHKEEIFLSSDMKLHKNKLITQDQYQCKKCGRIRNAYTIQGK